MWRINELGTKLEWIESLKKAGMKLIEDLLPINQLPAPGDSSLCGP